MNHLNLTQVEQLKEIGTHLRQVRQEQSISTEEVSAKTFIPSRLLKALDEGQLDQLPEPVFIQGFIRRYADALNLDGAALAKTFTTSLLPIKSETISDEFSKTRSSSIQPYLPYILFGGLIVAAVSGLFYLLNKSQTAQTQLQSKNGSVTQLQKTEAKSIASTPTSPKASQAKEPIQVIVDFKESSWLRVIADGKTQFEGSITKGKRRTWTAKKTLTIRAGNAGALLVAFNKKKQKPLGDLGDIKEVTFTPGK